MSNKISDTHPKQRLLFFVAQDVDDNIRILVKRMLADIALSMSWVIGEPKFIDVKEDVGSQEFDLPVETVGGMHEIYSALTPNDLPHEIDERHLKEVEQIVSFVRQLSLNEGLEFEFELDGQYVGTIDDGVIDVTLEKGLLNEWRTHLAST